MTSSSSTKVSLSCPSEMKPKRSACASRPPCARAPRGAGRCPSQALRPPSSTRPAPDEPAAAPPWRVATPPRSARALQPSARAEPSDDHRALGPRTRCSRSCHPTTPTTRTRKRNQRNFCRAALGRAGRRSSEGVHEERRGPAQASERDGFALETLDQRRVSGRLLESPRRGLYSETPRERPDQGQRRRKNQRRQAPSKHTVREAMGRERTDLSAHAGAREQGQ